MILSHRLIRLVNKSIYELSSMRLMNNSVLNNKKIVQKNFKQLVDIRSLCMKKNSIYGFSTGKQQGENKPRKSQNSNNPSEQQNKNEQQNFTVQQQSLIHSYNPDQVFNSIINQDPQHNFQKDLIVAKKRYQRSTKQLRANILFEDLLKTQIKIDIYNTKARPYNHWWIKNLFNLFFFGLTVWFLNSFSNLDPKNKVLLERTTVGKTITIIMYGFSIWFVIIGFYKYLKFQRRFVQKIVYDTQKENFIITKRKFFGARYEKEVSRYKIVYTENQFLNKKGTNYFHLDSKQQYSIPYKQYWIKQDLFSHLIAQRIKI